MTSSGIYALLIFCNIFQILNNINEDSTWNIKQDSHLAKLIPRTKLIIWHKAPMTQTLF